MQFTPLDDPEGRSGRSILLCQCCHGTEHLKFVESRVTSPRRCIFSPLSFLRTCQGKMCMCIRRAVRLQGVRVRCKCADTQLPRRQWGEEGGSARAGKGVNWAVIVQEAGYDWVKWQDLVRSTWGTLTAFCSFYLSSITLFLFVDFQAFILDSAFEM